MFKLARFATAAFKNHNTSPTSFLLEASLLFCKNSIF